MKSHRKCNSSIIAGHRPSTTRLDMLGYLLTKPRSSIHKFHLLILILILISIDPQRRLQQIQLFLQTLRLLPHTPDPALHPADNLIYLLLLLSRQGINKRGCWMSYPKIPRSRLCGNLEVISVRVLVRWR